MLISLLPTRFSWQFSEGQVPLSFPFCLQSLTCTSCLKLSVPRVLVHGHSIPPARSLWFISELFKQGMAFLTHDHGEKEGKLAGWLDGWVDGWTHRRPPIKPFPWMRTRPHFVENWHRRLTPGDAESHETSCGFLVPDGLVWAGPSRGSRAGRRQSSAAGQTHACTGFQVALMCSAWGRTGGGPGPQMVCICC